MSLESNPTLRLADIGFDYNGLLLIAGILLAIYAVVASTLEYISVERRFWKTHPWGGLQSLILSKTRAGLYAIRHTQELIERGYHEVNMYALESNQTIGD